MDEKTELLICLGASAAANCVPCFDYYFKKASVAGITFEEVRKSVDLACKIKTGVGIVMKNSIMDITGQDWDSEKKDSGKSDHPCYR
jgi:hypothetical protein